MSVLQNIRNFFTLRSSAPQSASSLVNPATWLMDFFGMRSKHGVVVNQTKAEGLTAYWRGVNIIAGTIAMLPFSVRERKANGDNQAAISHPLYDLIASAPNLRDTSFVARRKMMEHLLYNGNAYFLIKTNGNGRVIELLFIDSREIEPWEDPNGQLWYYYTPNFGQPRMLNPYEVLHFKGPHDDGLKGKNPIQVHRESLGENIATNEFGANFFRNGALLSGYIKHPKMLSPNATKNIREGFSTLFGGIENAGSVPVLDEGMEFFPISTSPRDANFIEQKNYGVNDISRILGVPAHMLSNNERSTFNNIEHLSLETLKYTFLPWIQNIEQEYNRKIFYASERGRFYVHLNVEGILRGSVAERGEYYKKMFSMGAMSINEIRRKEDFPSIDGGDRHFVQVNNVFPVDRIDDYVDNLLSTKIDPTTTDETEAEGEAITDDAAEQNANRSNTEMQKIQKILSHA